MSFPLAPNIEVHTNFVPLSYRRFPLVATRRMMLRILLPQDAGAFLDVLTERAATEAARINMTPTLDHARSKINARLEHANGIEVGIFTRNMEKLIGEGGICCLEEVHTWPTLDWYFISQYQGRGYEEEFLEKFMSHWKSLQRAEHRLNVFPASIGLAPGGYLQQPTEERICAEVSANDHERHGLLQRLWFIQYAQKDGVTFWVKTLD
ncbi:hypothetical protein F5Y15DRAFT_426830 [Xylariaceae sp. FL0016]|nr:hypothetical protein F5Y15DRAFT_426830 [Xylariaceae sp. FL0016]